MLGSPKTEEIELAKTPAGSLELVGVLLLRNLSGKSISLCKLCGSLCLGGGIAKERCSPQRHRDRTENHRDEFSDRLLNTSRPPCYPLTHVVLIS